MYGWGGSRPSLLAVLTPAADPALLSIEELRAAAGLAAGDDSQDTTLTSLGEEAAEWIASLCGVRTAGRNAPTMLRESLRETFPPGPRRSELILARRFIATVTSVTENNVTLTEDVDFVLLDDRGVLERQIGGYPVPWRWATIVVEYDAGFDNGSPANLPPVIKGVAADYVTQRYTSAGRDPSIRSETTVDLDTVAYRDAADARSAFEDNARERLWRFLAAGSFA